MMLMEQYEIHDIGGGQADRSSPDFPNSDPLPLPLSSSTTMTTTRTSTPPSSSSPDSSDNSSVYEDWGAKDTTTIDATVFMHFSLLSDMIDPSRSAESSEFWSYCMRKVHSRIEDIVKSVRQSLKSIDQHGVNTNDVLDIRNRCFALELLPGGIHYLFQYATACYSSEIPQKIKDVHSILTALKIGAWCGVRQTNGIDTLEDLMAKLSVQTLSARKISAVENLTSDGPFTVSTNINVPRLDYVSLVRCDDPSMITLPNLGLQPSFDEEEASYPDFLKPITNQYHTLQGSESGINDVFAVDTNSSIMMDEDLKGLAEWLVQGALADISAGIQY